MQYELIRRLFIGITLVWGNWCSIYRLRAFACLIYGVREGWMQYAAGRDVCVVWGPLGEELSEIKDNIALFYYQESTVISDCTSGLAVSERITRGMEEGFDHWLMAAHSAGSGLLSI